jgi:hypothetical protein
MGSENTPGCAQNLKNGSGFEFLERYHNQNDQVKEDGMMQGM